MEVLLLCLQIFIARNIDVGLGTIRQILSVKGKNILAALIAFIEVFIWFNIAREALNTRLDNILIPIFYAAGYASGTFIGGTLAKKHINCVIGFNIIFENFNKNIEKEIKEAGFGMTIIDIEDTAKGHDKKMVYIQTNNKKTKKLINLIKDLDPKAFIVSNETKFIQNGFIK